MKKLTLFACALCMSVCAMAQTAFYVYKTDGSRVEYAIADVDSISFTAPAVSIENGHEYVDLGLPSGTKWATCNVGATSPEEYGDYYAWGETEPKTTYSWRTYKYGPYYGELTKYPTMLPVSIGADNGVCLPTTNGRNCAKTAHGHGQL